METLKNKSQITAKTIKQAEHEFKGRLIGYDPKNKLYFSGSLFHSWRDEFLTIQDLKNSF